MTKQKVAEFPICDFVAKLVTDPANPPSLSRLRGYLGESDSRDRVRLYLNPELSEYIDIPSQAMLNVQEAPRTNEPAGLVDVWIQRGADLIRKDNAAFQGASFLQGPVRRERAAGLPTQGPRRHAHTVYAATSKGDCGTQKAGDTCDAGCTHVYEEGGERRSPVFAEATASGCEGTQVRDDTCVHRCPSDLTRASQAVYAAATASGCDGTQIREDTCVYRCDPPHA